MWLINELRQLAHLEVEYALVLPDLAADLFDRVDVDVDPLVLLEKLLEVLALDQSFYFGRHLSPLVQEHESQEQKLVLFEFHVLQLFQVDCG